MGAYKNASGAYFLRGLFYETTLEDKATVVYTLKEQDHMGYPSLYRLYMEADDPTEYTFAVANLDGWNHWERLLESTWFKPYVTKWRKELEVRAKARALLAIRKMAEDGKDAFQANKFLLSGQWKDAPAKRKAGQPSKDEIKQEANRLARDANALEEDFLRIAERVN